MIAQIVVAACLTVVCGLCFVGSHPELFPVICFSVWLAFMIVVIASAQRPVSLTIDHTRGIVWFKPGVLSRRKEIPISRVTGVAIEPATHVPGQSTGRSGLATVGRICLVLDDRRVPIDERTTANRSAHREALAQIRNALEVARPSDDA
jgi:hypothetical protein